MAHTPKPWKIGGEGIVAPTVPYEQSRQYGWDITWRKRHGRDTVFNEYQGELVGESYRFDDMVEICAASENEAKLIEVLTIISQATNIENIQTLAASTVLMCSITRERIASEGRELQHEYQLTRMLQSEEMRPMLRLPETATRARIELLPAYLPLRYVTDNIERAWEIENSIPF